MAKALIIGARCRRQGIGEYVARSLSRAGAGVRAIVGTTAETAGEAREALRRYGIECSAYTSVEAALQHERPDVVAICSPYAVHYENLEAVLESGAHCLCEKPLWWAKDANRKAATARIVDGFIEAGRYLAMITQWPYTLPAFYDLYPRVERQPVERFAMELSPIAPGRGMILDAAPHLLSMLQSLVGLGEIRAPRLRFRDRTQRELEVDFDYHHTAGAASVAFRASVCVGRPRPACYVINGFRVDRGGKLPEYEIYFSGGGRRVRLEDPLELLVKDFLEKVEAGATADRGALIHSITALEELYCTEELES